MDSIDLAASPAAIALGGNRYKAIFRLALPTVFAMLAQTIVNDIDLLFFKHLPMPDASYAQAALLPALILTWAFGGSLSAISVGTQALVARRYAEGNRLAAGAVLGNAVFFCIGAGAIFSIVGIALLPWLVRLIVEGEAVQHVVIAYTRWRLLAVISMSATMALKAFFDGIGKTYVHLVASILMNVFNVLLCWMLIFGHLGAPAMGTAGAGCAAFLATWIGLGVMGLYAWAARSDYHPMRIVNVSGKTIWALLKLSVPAAVATLVMMGGFAGLAHTVSMLDARAVGEPINEAANTDIIEILKLTFVSCMAFGTATATLIGQALGRKEPEEAQRWGWASVRLGLVVFGIVGLCEGVLFTHGIVHFIASSARVEHAMMFPLRAMGVATPLIAVAMILTEGLFGAGNPKFVAVAQFLLIFVWLVPGAYLLSIVLHFGLQGVWVSAFVYACLAAAVMSGKFAGGTWKNIKL
ncbi:MAG TPA: MATE family efflux transporter [Polyangiaceae bacterium]|jgi:putative MATE family efflux protein